MSICLYKYIYKINIYLYEYIDKYIYINLYKYRERGRKGGRERLSV